MIIKAENWQRPTFSENDTTAQKVSHLLKTIERSGDKAVDNYAIEFDQQLPQQIELLPFADYQLEPELAESIKRAAARIESFARFQFESFQSKSFSDEFGTYQQIVSSLERIGAYIPGGRFPLISSALMTLIPAKVAACPVRIACSVSDNPAIQAAASLAGATHFLQIGGVQAIAALAFGYQTIKPVDLIVGPGNAYVNEAKKQLQSKVRIDGLAGPSEMLAICDGEQPIEWLALDALAQAEHDPLACSLIVSDDSAWLVEMLSYLEKNAETLALLKRQQIQLIYADSCEQLISFSESYAPEHLMLCHRSIAPEQLTHYGSLFIGANSAVALGDYITGPNHTLPTLGYARQTGGLSVANYLKIATSQEINLHGRQQLSQLAQPLAEAEGLNYHAKSLAIRAE